MAILASDDRVTASGRRVATSFRLADEWLRPESAARHGCRPLVFSSTVFLFFFLPMVLATSLLAPRSWKNVTLLAWSLAFYAFGEGLFVLVMLASIAANWALGLAIDRAQRRPRDTALGVDPKNGDRSVGTGWVAAAVVVNLSLLIGFKYANFLVDNLNLLLVELQVATIEIDPVHLPIGVSFFTFQAMSYVIDVHRRDAPAQRNPFDLALYISLFPQLIAGPIVRYRDVAAQIASRRVDLCGVSDGVRRFVWGLGKKVLIANTMAVPADRVFSVPDGELGVGLAWFGAACYALQIYFDFSGYSDMAIGLGRMFGFRFRENFDHPYVARSITGFWRRWHISLSSWFRDYLYIPLGGSRGGSVKTGRNLILVFLLCGLWHGAAWTFVLWGGWHGVFLVLERITGTRGVGVIGPGASSSPVPSANSLFVVFSTCLRHLYVLVVVLCGWVLFRSETPGQAGAFLKAMFGLGSSATGVASADLVDGVTAVVLVAGVLGSLPWAPRLGRWLANAREKRPSAFREGAVAISENVTLVVVLLLSVAALAAGTHNPFIYFRF